MSRIKDNVNRRVSQISEWMANEQLKQTRNRFDLVNNETILLLDEVMLFNDLFNSGNSIIQSNELSTKATQKAMNFLSEFKIEMAQIVDEIRTKSNLPWFDLELDESVETRLKINESLESSSVQVCGSISCSRCDREYDESDNFIDECSNGLLSSYDEFNRLNKNTLKLYNETEMKLKHSIVEVRIVSKNFDIISYGK